MIVAQDVIARAQAAGLALSAGTDGLKIRGPRGALTSELLALIQGHKPELLALLAGNDNAAGDGDRRAYWRDCIRDALLTTPKGVRIRRVALGFLDTELALQAIEHGWDELQLFGVTRTDDEALLDRRGDLKERHRSRRGPRALDRDAPGELQRQPCRHCHRWRRRPTPAEEKHGPGAFCAILAIEGFVLPAFRKKRKRSMKAIEIAYPAPFFPGLGFHGTCRLPFASLVMYACIPIDEREGYSNLIGCLRTFSSISDLLLSASFKFSDA
jgi:hypothetical protein